VSSGPAAARAGAPILLATTTSLPAQTAAALSDLGITDAIIVGGPVAVSVDVESQIAAALGGADAVDRVFGASRYSTSTAVADAELTALGGAGVRVWLATGLKFPDALAAGPAVARAGDVLVLIADDAQETFDWLAANGDSFTGVRIAGGTVAVSQAAGDAAVAAVKGG
jgi:putative cell wall-binding protein